MNTVPKLIQLPAYEVRVKVNEIYIPSKTIQTDVEIYNEMMINNVRGNEFYENYCTRKNPNYKKYLKHFNQSNFIAINLSIVLSKIQHLDVKEDDIEYILIDSTKDVNYNGYHLRCASTYILKCKNYEDLYLDADIIPIG